MSTTSEDLIKVALDALRTGSTVTAKNYLTQVVKQEPNNARAWYLLSQVVENPEQKRYCLERVLTIQPNNQQVKDLLTIQADIEGIGGTHSLSTPTQRNSPVNIKPITPQEKSLEPSKKQIDKTKSNNPLIMISIILISVISICILLVGMTIFFGYDNNSHSELPNETKEEEKQAIRIVQNWKQPGWPDMTCKDVVDLGAFPYVKYGDASITWTASKDEDNYYIVQVQMHNQNSSVSFRWRVNIITKTIDPLDEETLCPISGVNP